MRYKVKVTEILVKFIHVEADSAEAAREKAENMWFDNEIGFNVLDDHDDHEIEVIDGGNW